jgi:Uma2 family endonuclease
MHSRAVSEAHDQALPARKLDQHYTYADYKIWPEDERWELIDGVAWNMSPAPSRIHQWLVMELGSKIRNFLDEKTWQVYSAPFDVFFPEDPDQLEDNVCTVVQPDLTIICDHKKLTKKGCFGAPELVIEILSPYTSKKDLNEKFNLYESSGVLEYWVIDPGYNSIQSFTLDRDGNYGDGEVFVGEGNLVSKVLDGFIINLSDLFSDPGI